MTAVGGEVSCRRLVADRATPLSNPGSDMVPDVGLFLDITGKHWVLGDSPPVDCSVPRRTTAWPRSKLPTSSKSVVDDDLLAE